MPESSIVNYDSLVLENHKQLVRQSIGTILTCTHCRLGNFLLHSRQSCGTVGPHDETYFAYEASWWKARLRGKEKTNSCGKPNEWKENNTVLLKNV